MNAAQLGRRLTGTSSHVKDRPLVGMWLPGGNEDNFQRQFSPRSSPAVFEYSVNSAAQLLLYAFDVTGRQRHAGCSGYGHRRDESRECSPQDRDRNQGKCH